MTSTDVPPRMTLDPSTMEMNPRVAQVQPSQTLAMSARASELRREGKPIISLSAGEPDFDTPEPIARAGKQAIDEGFTNYTANAGMPELREAICRKLETDNGLDYDPEEILCCNGAKQAIAQAVMAVCRPDDEVLIPAPYWVSYPEMVRLAGATPVPLPTRVKDSYRVRPADLEEAIGPQTRLLFLCSPSNPTGTAYPPEELEALAEVLREYPEVLIISDEIYEHIRFEGEHQSFAGLPGMRDRTITINGFSKAYAMTGWRLGYQAAPAPIRNASAKIQSQVTSGPCSISQRAGLAALQMDPEPVQEMVAAFQERRDFIVEALQDLPGVECPEPMGAFYVFPQVSSYYGTTAPSGREIADSSDLCFYLLEECHVASVPGAAFGERGGLRMSYAVGLDDLREAMDRVREGLAALE